MSREEVPPAQLRNSSVPSTRRTTHSAKIIDAAVIALLAAGNTFANAAENPARTAQEQHACAVVLGLDPSERRCDACIRSLEGSLSERNYARLVSTDRGACARDGLQPGTPAFAVCVADAAESANKSAWTQDSLACADLDIDPSSPIFSQCVADLHHSLSAAKTQNLTD